MANKLFPKYKQAILSTGVNLVSGTVKAVLIDTGAYTQSDAHQFLSSVPAGARIGTPATLANKTVVDGVFDADDSMFSSVPVQTGTAAAEEAILIYLDTGTEATSVLIAYIDTATGLPVTPNGGNVVITWSGSGIFAI